VTLNLIDPAQIPQFVGDLDQLETAAQGLKADGGNISKTGGDIHTKFQGLSVYYEAPEAEQLFATTRPVQQAANTFGDSLATVADALTEYAHTVRPIARQLQDLQRRATDFRKSIEGHPHWRSNGDRVKEHNDLWAEVNAAVSAFETAARTAADKIDKIFNGTQYIADDGSHKPNMYGYSADQLDHAKGLPWGEPVEQTHRWNDFGHWIGQFWNGFVIDGADSVLSGLGHMINPFDWNTFTQTWSGLGHVAVGFYARFGPNPAAAGYSVANGVAPGGVSGLPTGELPQWMQDDKQTFSNFAKSMVAWDEWKKNPVRAAGSTLFNGLTLAAGPAAKLGEAGDAGRFAMAAKTAGVLGKAGRLVDPMTYISKSVGQVASKLPRISDIAAAIDHFKTGDAPAINNPTKLHGVELPDGSFKFTGNSAIHTNGKWHFSDGTTIEAVKPRELAVTHIAHDVPHAAEHLAISDHTPGHGWHEASHAPGLTDVHSEHSGSRSESSWQAMGTRRGQEARFSPKSKIPVPPKVPGDVVLDTGDHVYYKPESTAIGYDGNTRLNFDYVAPRSGYHDVVVHGNNKGFFMPGRVNAAGADFPPGEVSASHIAEAIRNNPHYHGGPVRLISCHSGDVLPGIPEVPAAQLIANELGVPVLAPTNEVGIFPNLPPGQEPVILKGGYWRTFLPIME
jgi:uncharacterized protein YukE